MGWKVFKFVLLTSVVGIVLFLAYFNFDSKIVSVKTESNLIQKSNTSRLEDDTNHKFNSFCRTNISGLTLKQLTKEAAKYSLTVEFSYKETTTEIYFRSLCKLVERQNVVSTWLADSRNKSDWQRFLTANSTNVNKLESVKIISEAPQPRSFSNLTKSVLKNYCNYHGYNLVNVGKSVAVGNMRKEWQKIFLIRQILNSSADGTIVVWMDDDVLVTNFSIRIENFFHLTNRSDIEFVISGDYIGEIDKLFNSGVILMRNSLEMRRFIDSWIEGYDRYREYQYGGHLDQNVLVLVYLQNEQIQSKSLILPLTLLQSFGNLWVPTDFLLHLAGGGSDMKRLLKFQQTIGGHKFL